MKTNALPECHTQTQAQAAPHSFFKPNPCSGSVACPVALHVLERATPAVLLRPGHAASRAVRRPSGASAAKHRRPPPRPHPRVHAPAHPLVSHAAGLAARIASYGTASEGAPRAGRVPVAAAAGSRPGARAGAGRAGRRRQARGLQLSRHGSDLLLQTALRLPRARESRPGPLHLRAQPGVSCRRRWAARAALRRPSAMHARSADPSPPAGDAEQTPDVPAAGRNGSTCRSRPLLGGRWPGKQRGAAYDRSARRAGASRRVPAVQRACSRSASTSRSLSSSAFFAAAASRPGRACRISSARARGGLCERGRSAEVQARPGLPALAAARGEPGSPRLRDAKCMRPPARLLAASAWRRQAGPVLCTGAMYRGTAQAL